MLRNQWIGLKSFSWLMPWMSHFLPAGYYESASSYDCRPPPTDTHDDKRRSAKYFDRPDGIQTGVSCGPACLRLNQPSGVLNEFVSDHNKGYFSGNKSITSITYRNCGLEHDPSEIGIVIGRMRLFWCVMIYSNVRVHVLENMWQVGEHHAIDLRISLMAQIGGVLWIVEESLRISCIVRRSCIQRIFCVVPLATNLDASGFWCEVTFVAGAHLMNVNVNRCI